MFIFFKSVRFGPLSVLHDTGQIPNSSIQIQNLNTHMCHVEEISAVIGYYIHQGLHN